MLEFHIENSEYLIPFIDTKKATKLKLFLDLNTLKY